MLALLLGFATGGAGCAGAFLKATDDYAGALIRASGPLSEVWPRGGVLCRTSANVDFLRYRLSQLQAQALAARGRRDRREGTRDWLGYDAEADAGDPEAARLGLLWRERCEEADRAALVMDGAFTTLRGYARGAQEAASSGAAEPGGVKGPADAAADLAARLDDKAAPEVQPLKALGTPLAGLATLLDQGYSDRRLRELVQKCDESVAAVLTALGDYLGRIDAGAAQTAGQLRAVAKTGERRLSERGTSDPLATPTSGGAPPTFVQISGYVQLISDLSDEIRDSRAQLAKARAAVERLARAHGRLRTAAARRDRRGHAEELERFREALAEATTAIGSLGNG